MNNRYTKTSRPRESSECFQRADTDLIHRVEEQSEELKTKNCELEALNQKIRTLARKIQESIENDRHNIAKELHDSIGANLAAIKFSLEQRLFELGKPNQIDRISFEPILFNLVETIKEIKRISHGLWPSTLDSLGLLVTISSHIKKLKEIYPLITFDLELSVVEDDVPDSLKIVIFRILQEALNNTCRNSEADYVRVRLEKFSKTLVLIISDNGCGFVSDVMATSAENVAGYNIQSIYDHVEIFDGVYLIDSKPNEGTNIQVSLPCCEN